MKNYSKDPSASTKKTLDSKKHDINKKAISTIDGKLHNQNEDKMKQKADPGNSIFQCRYIITLMEFFVFAEIDAYRLATSMSVVAMVNSTAINSHDTSNVTVDSCPMNASDSTENLAPQPDGEFDWSPEIQGYILGAGFLGYVINQIPGGLLAEAYGAKNTIVIGIFLSSVAHLLSPFAAWSSSYLMIAMQLLRGLGQGLLPPAHSVLAANWYPSTERGFLNAIVMAGSVIGSLISCFSAGALCASSFLGGWPSVYYIYGALGLILCLWVQMSMYESPRVHPSIKDEELNYILQNQETDLSQKRPPTPWKKIFTSIPFYAMTFAVFSHFWAITQLISVHPIFLGRILHFSIQENGLLTSLPFVFEALLIFLGSWVSKWLNNRNYVGVDKVRKGCNFIYCLGYSLGLLGVYYAACDRMWSNILSITATSFIGLSVPGCMVVPIDMSPTFAGSLFGLSNTIASTASFILPVIVGLMIDKDQTLEQWNKIFMLCIGVVMSSGIIFWIFGSAEVQPWNFTDDEQDDEKCSKESSKKNKNENPEHFIDSITHL
ncbi:putative inorganic phosphate cotransporter [Caerostris darwini]|uniref:Inorganic phosphate cotransporter n=1 Tax=Caerostris darwini TaxID=1538125 RepID=A0AAV4VYZ1_9ARAC|nr:putative inorganic phosphate cotransporter [Caerostris darwini]